MCEAYRQGRLPAKPELGYQAALRRASFTGAGVEATNEMTKKTYARNSTA